MVERYQMVACIGLRKSESEEMVTVPLYIKKKAVRYRQNRKILSIVFPNV